MHREIALIVLVVAILFLVFIGPPVVGGAFLVVGVLTWFFGGRIEGGRGRG